MPHIRNPREDMCFRRMFGVFKWGNRASENLSYLLRVAELLGGRAGIVTRRVVASEQAGQGSSYTCTRAPPPHTHTDVRARTHTHTQSRARAYTHTHTHPCARAHTHTHTHVSKARTEVTAQPLLPMPQVPCWARGREERREGGLLPECRAVTWGSQVRTWWLREGRLAQSHPHACITPHPGGSIWGAMGLYSSNTTWAPGSHVSPLVSPECKALSTMHGT